MNIGYLLSFLLSWAAGTGFALAFRIGIRDALWAGVAAGCGWTIFHGLDALGVGNGFATFGGAFGIAAAAEVLARLRREPVTLFFIGGIIPLVPGVTTYRAMQAFAQGQVTQGLGGIFTAFVDAGAIAAALAMADGIAQGVSGALRRRRHP
ncbi:MAG: threonine/serine exporter family protein [Firmicutes bacterium]|nr:threonine/serine exporter family protein [Bacillota bacterium]